MRVSKDGMLVGVCPHTVFNHLFMYAEVPIRVEVVVRVIYLHAACIQRTPQSVTFEGGV
jgi:hypothetical protein